MISGMGSDHKGNAEKTSDRLESHLDHLPHPLLANFNQISGESQGDSRHLFCFSSLFWIRLILTTTDNKKVTLLAALPCGKKQDVASHRPDENLKSDFRFIHKLYQELE